MLRQRIFTGTAVAGLALIGVAAVRADRHSDGTTPGTYGMRVAPIKLGSIGVMTFGSDATLYVADSRAGAVYAIDVGETERDTSTSGLNVKAIDERIASTLNTSKNEILIHDMVA